MKKQMKFSGYIIAALLAVVFLITPAMASDQDQMDHKKMDHDKKMDHKKMDHDKKMDHKKKDHKKKHKH